MKLFLVGKHWLEISHAERRVVVNNTLNSYIFYIALWDREWIIWQSPLDSLLWRKKIFFDPVKTFCLSDFMNCYPILLQKFRPIIDNKEHNLKIFRSRLVVFYIYIYRVCHLTFFSTTAYFVNGNTSSCLIWHIISFILPPNEYNYIYAWSTLRQVGLRLIYRRCWFWQKKIIFSYEAISILAGM